MPAFRFLHAADIHLDSPLHGLSRYEGLPVDEIRSATRAAFDGLIQAAIDEAVDFVVIAGDLFDGDWRDMATGLYFAKAVGRLDRAGIPTFILAGNHDSASSITRALTWPLNIRVFNTKRAETHILADLGVALHGQGFSTPAVSENLVLAYPAAVDGHFNVGILHTALSGRPGHANYAPCTSDDLRGLGYDYWALGHVHEFEIVSEHPHIVFPGNIQGRNIRESGSKGAVIVTVEDGVVRAVDRIDLGVIMWTRVDIDCTGAAPDDIVDRVRAGLSLVRGESAGGRAIIVRVSLVGAMKGAGEVLDRAAVLREEVRAVALSISSDLYVEKVRVLVTEPGDGGQAILGEDLDGLIAEASGSPELVASIEADLGRFVTTAKTALVGSVDGDLRLAAEAASWAEITKAASTALRSRLRRAN